ncbi:MAG TPA: hypothetical protein VI336_02390 [Candidatus Saccharimonadales bacterium]|nr:hypothetical protein [Candidatus Saccharimonadales bacterium]
MTTKKVAAGASSILATVGFAVFAAVPASATHIDTASLTDNAVTSAKIAEYTIGGRDLGEAAVGTRAISDYSIGGRDLGTAAVGTRAISDGSIAGADLAANIAIATTGEVGVTAADDGVGSFQGVWADVTLPAAAMTGSYHGGIMGNVFGTNVGDTDSAMFGVLGKYTIDGTNASTEPKGGVIGEVAGDPVTTTADGAVIAVLGGDAGVTTADAAFKVMGQNSTAGSGFTYGLDLFNVNTGAYLDNDVLVGTDIRLQNGETISNAVAGTIDFGGANLAKVDSAATRATGATGSYQSIAGDVTYEGAAGGTSSYHAGVMGNFKGSALTNANASIHAGVIGSYTVDTSDANIGPKAGVVGEVGFSDSDLPGVAEAAVMAVLGGDAGSLTPNAAYGVAYLNSTASSKFDYGLDLSHAAIGSYQAVTYGVADIRLASGATISSGTTNPTAACVLGSLFLNTTDAKLYVCTVVTPTWTIVGTQT